MKESHKMDSQDNLRNEYTDTGMIRQCFQVEDKSLLEQIKEDYYLHFQSPIEEFKRNGINRVPYKITESITRIAHDPNIDLVVKSIFKNEPWVMWGPNIQLGTPNRAYQWHVDFESNNFPTVTVMIGVEGCSSDNATTCIPYTHQLSRRPGDKWHELDPEVLVQNTVRLDPRCDKAVRFKEFGNGKFYAFNAKTWHAGDISTSGQRMILILHYQKASDLRIPMMKDYSKGRWFDYPAPYIVEKGYEGSENNSLYKIKKPGIVRRAANHTLRWMGLK